MDEVIIDDENKRINKNKIRWIVRILSFVIPVTVIIGSFIMYKSAKSKSDNLRLELNEKSEECRKLEIQVTSLETENQIVLAEKTALQEKFDNMIDEKYQISSDIRYLETKLASRLLLVTYFNSKEDIMTLQFTNATGTIHEVYINRKDKEIGKDQLYNEFSDYISECKEDEMLLVAFVYDIGRIHNKEYHIITDVINQIKEKNNNVLFIEKELSYSE